VKEVNKIKVIFNADDFGLTKGVNLGIIETFKNGPVRSTTIMAGADEFEHAVKLSKDNPNLKVGIHLTLTAINSVGGVYQTLTDEKGKLLPLSIIEQRAREGKLNLEEVEVEYQAQIEKVLQAGIKPSHLDSHHHTHGLLGVQDVVLKVARKYGIDKIRMVDNGPPESMRGGLQTTDYFEVGFFGEGATFKNLKKLLRNVKKGSVEVMVHPGYMDSVLPEISSYNKMRNVEKDILTSEELREFLKQGNYEIADFSDL